MNIKNDLIKEGISILNNLGFQRVNNENIFYDEVYSIYFLNFLRKKKRKSDTSNPIIEQMIQEIQNKSSV